MQTLRCTHNLESGELAEVFEVDLNRSTSMAEELGLMIIAGLRLGRSIKVHCVSYGEDGTICS